MGKKALLVGINDYAPVGPGGSDLSGCVNDVRDMANTLVICGFPASTMRVLTNARATKANILNGLAWLLKGTKKGDTIVFYYSGHGSYKVDLSGDEVDGKDELICPHDWPQHISDDDLKAIFSKLPAGVQLEVIMDCCHSGTGTRASMVLPGEETTELLTPRFIEPPFDDTIYEEFKADYKRGTKHLFAEPVAAAKTRAVSIVPRLNHVLWAGCKDSQVSYETTIGGQQRGIFTYNFCKVLRATSGAITRKKLDSTVTAAISRAGFSQTPQLEGTRSEIDARIFT
ncbi:MAG: caspase family protein [Chitinophagales bacterium]|nr:caspase family protein [Chitinophagales bacterium]